MLARNSRQKSGNIPVFTWLVLPLVAIVCLQSLFAPDLAAKPLKVGELPPEMIWVTVSGDSLTWDELQNDRPLVMVFWATWCHVCKKEWPKLQEIYEDHEAAENAATWASVSLGEPAEKVLTVARERNLPGVTLADPQEVNGKVLGIDYVPAMCVLAPSGEVAYMGPTNIKKLKKLLKRFAAAGPAKE